MHITCWHVVMKYFTKCIPSQLRPTSIEKEIFPRMAQDDDLFAYNLSGTYEKISGFLLTVIVKINDIPT